MNNRIIIRDISKPLGAEILHIDNGSISNQLESCYEYKLKKLKSAKEIVTDNEVVGYYITKMETIDNSDFDENEVYFATCLDILYLNKSFRNQGIGKNILFSIVKKSKAFSDDFGIRFLLVHALREKVNWYSSKGFIVIDDDNKSPTVLMVMDFIDRQEIDNYVENP